MMLIRGPGVYRPQADTWLLAQAMARAALPQHAHVLDACTGTGALAIEAARAGAASVTAVDVSRRAVTSAWLNCRLRGISAELLHGDFADVLAGRTFDVVLANPPYVPSPRPVPARGAARAWEAGSRGRAILDKLCALLPALLTARGMALLVHSVLCDADLTVNQLREGGLKAAIVARDTIVLGPVMQSKTRWLTESGLIHPGQQHEELVVVRADQPDR
ncbi:HemK2/MTQ2 family protein methyltransferase [Nocardia sp. NPDC023852]|uniref:HemK2/MTQ2 family protein methyltransferase n=1 Tax=Nocardia sp. NPDC023852 TaxID=3154697 RepID=UPI0033C4F14E